MIEQNQTAKHKIRSYKRIKLKYDDKKNKRKEKQTWPKKTPQWPQVPPQITARNTSIWLIEAQWASLRPIVFAPENFVVGPEFISKLKLWGLFLDFLVSKITKTKNKDGSKMFDVNWCDVKLWDELCAFF